LSRERLAVGGIGRSAISRGPDDADARTEYDDPCEEQKRFAFGGRCHGDKIASPIAK
jgi:hypothetical protein